MGHRQMESRTLMHPPPTHPPKKKRKKKRKRNEAALSIIPKEGSVILEPV